MHYVIYGAGGVGGDFGGELFEHADYPALANDDAIHQRAAGGAFDD